MAASQGCARTAACLPRVLAAVACAAGRGLAASVSSGSASLAFEAFVARHGRGYAPGSEEYARRRALFEARLAEVSAHNSRPDRTWEAEALGFADWTEGERARLRGYRRTPGLEDSSAGGAALLEQGPARSPDLPPKVDWRNLSMAKPAPNQGACGSCWAVATVSALEAHREIHVKKTGKLAVQELVSCVQNPRHCGGKGGCDGATVELGMDYVVKNGLNHDSSVPYHAKDTPCKPTELARLQGRDQPSGSTSLGLTSFTALPSNKQEPLMRSLAESGPVAVSAAANNWFEYRSGVFDACEKDAVVDHAITMYGYGNDKKVGRKYWLIRNSWGPEWGEDGFMRILRRDNEQQWCGVDHDPKKGTGCDGGPSSVPVCGTCGILYDSVVPHFGTKAARGRGHGGRGAAAAPATAATQVTAAAAAPARGRGHGAAAQVGADGHVARLPAEGGAQRAAAEGDDSEEGRAAVRHHGEPMMMRRE